MLGEYQERFNALRKRLFDAIAIELKADDGYCKSYEGSLEWIIEYPNYFEDCLAIREPLYTLKLHCYVGVLLMWPIFLLVVIVALPVCATIRIMEKIAEGENEKRK